MKQTSGKVAKPAAATKTVMIKTQTRGAVPKGCPSATPRPKGGKR